MSLYLCATPIGNLEDITLRVLHTLEQADCIAAEDTRHTLKILNHYNIHTKMTSYHEHNKQSKGVYLVERMKNGENIALVTDAGMPGISDPGADLVRLCYEADVEVRVLPGASAVITAVVLSGLDTRRFVFEGFIPMDKKERRAVLHSIKQEHRTMVFYEAPHRLMDTLKELAGVLGEDRPTACIREMTKKFEELRRGTLGEQLLHFKDTAPKGEFAIVVAGLSLQTQRLQEIEDWAEISIDEHMKQYTDKGMEHKDAMKQVAKDRGVSKREIYAYLHHDSVNLK